jgi:hypothetical protein
MNKVPQSDQSGDLLHEINAFLVGLRELRIVSRELDRRQGLLTRFLGSDELRAERQ